MGLTYHVSPIGISGQIEPSKFDICQQPGDGGSAEGGFVTNQKKYKK